MHATLLSYYAAKDEIANETTSETTEQNNDIKQDDSALTGVIVSSLLLCVTLIITTAGAIAVFIRINQTKKRKLLLPNVCTYTISIITTHTFLNRYDLIIPMLQLMEQQAKFSLKMCVKMCLSPLYISTLSYQ